MRERTVTARERKLLLLARVLAELDLDAADDPELAELASLLREPQRFASGMVRFWSAQA